MIKKPTGMVKAKSSSNIVRKEYLQVLSGILKEIKNTYARTTISANKELTKLYWTIGKIITEQQELNHWGSNFIEKIAQDLQTAFPGIAGFSRTNVFRMKAFFLAYPKNPTAVGLIEDLPVFSIPWGHNAVLLEKLKEENQRLWYAQKTIEKGWSRSILETWIKSNLYKREGKAITNFPNTLEQPHAQMVHQTLKDPYLFDFLTLFEDHVEQDVEQGLIDHIQKFLLELGEGFAFIGRQVHLHVGDEDYYIDLLFYHVKLRCYCVIELKNTKFKPEYAGKLNFYLSAVDDLLRHAEDKPTIGLLLCKTKDNFTVEYALRDINKPIGVAGYETKLVERLPKDLKSSLPSVEEIEAGLAKQEIIEEIKSTKATKKRSTTKRG
jgi:predicted nuclease of restriction endonuclease-like (RecB) superfamily